MVSYSKDTYLLDKVQQYIAEQGGESVFLDVEQYLNQWYISSIYNQNQWTIQLKNGDKCYNAADFQSIWGRRYYNMAQAALQQLEPAYRPAALEEARTTIFGFLNSLTQAFHLNHYMQNRVAEIKEWQMKVATELGLLLPPSCISNDPDTVRQFVETCKGEVIAKMQGSSMVQKNGEELFVMTNKLSAEQLTQLDSVQYTPMLFQAFIPKTIEYRVTLVGRKAYTISLDTSLKEEFLVDWRRDVYNSTKYWKKDRLPADIEAKLFAYMDYFYLNYGAADILLSPDGQYYFLEMNPAGEFGWADAHWDGEISRAIAELLMDPSLGRPCSPFFK